MRRRKWLGFLILWIGTFQIKAQIGDVPLDYPNTKDASLYAAWEIEQMTNFEQFYETSEYDFGVTLVSFQAPEEPSRIFDSIRVSAMDNDPTVSLFRKFGPIADSLKEAALLKIDANGEVVAQKSEADLKYAAEQQSILLHYLRQRQSRQFLDKNYLFRSTHPFDRRRFSPRLEIRELDVRDSIEHSIFQRSRGTLGMILANRLSPIDEFTVQVDASIKMGENYGLCRDEPYWDQPSSCFCTAFLVDSNIVATAAHCIQYLPLDQIKFILGFELARREGLVDYKIQGRDVFTATEIVGGSESQSLDFVLLRLDRTASAQKVLKVATSPPALTDSVYAIGFPSGLPMKVAGIGDVTQMEGDTYFYSNIDTYEGNSGSPVFNSRTHEVVGILIEGDQDFENRGNCRKAKDCYGRGCKGEKAISAVQILPFLENVRQSR